MCVFCKQSEKYFYNLWHGDGEGEAHMCLHPEQEEAGAGAGVGKDVRKGESNDRGKEKLPRQMESFWPNEMRTTSVVGRLVGGGNWCLGTGWGLGNGYDNFYDSRLIEMRMY